MKRHSRAHVRREMERHVWNRIRAIERYGRREYVEWWVSDGRPHPHRLSKRWKTYAFEYGFVERDDWFLRGKLRSALCIQRAERMEYGRTFGRHVSVQEAWCD